MVPLKTFELRAGHIVETLVGPATVVSKAPDEGGGYRVQLRYPDEALVVLRNVDTDAVWDVDLRS